MVITSGPLLILPSAGGNEIWLKSPERPTAPAVATVWKWADRCRGNAAVMAFAGEMYAAVCALAEVKSAEEAGAAKKRAKALIARIEEAAAR